MCGLGIGVMALSIESCQRSVLCVFCLKRVEVNLNDNGLPTSRDPAFLYRNHPAPLHNDTHTLAPLLLPQSAESSRQRPENDSSLSFGHPRAALSATARMEHQGFGLENFGSETPCSIMSCRAALHAHEAAEVDSRPRADILAARLSSIFLWDLSKQRCRTKDTMQLGKRVDFCSFCLVCSGHAALLSAHLL